MKEKKEFLTEENYERGKSYPDIPILRKIEEVYGVPYNRLIFLPLDYDKTVNLMWLSVRDRVGGEGDAFLNDTNICCAVDNSSTYPVFNEKRK